MHSAFFGIKKVHWRLVGITQAMIREHGLTPARFDLMRVVMLYPEEEGIAQGTLKWLLGVAAPTVSRMLKALEERGYITRDRGADRRFRIVRLTPRGQRATHMSLLRTVGFDEDRWLAARGVLGNTMPFSRSIEQHCAVVREGAPKLSHLHELLANMRKAFGDTAPFPHPWRAGNFLAPPVRAVFDKHGELTLQDAFSLV